MKKRVKVPIQREATVFDIEFKFFPATGILKLSGLDPHEEAIVMVNKDEFVVTGDNDGIAELDFEKSPKSVPYFVRLKDPKERKDRRLCFYY